MPPKSQKKETKKAVEDKTFGLKNKNKSSKVGKYVQAVEHQVKIGGSRQKLVTEEQLKAERALAKKNEAAARAEAASLFKPVISAQKVAPGVDPKTVLCAFFKQGLCLKGNRCKFSHNLEVDRKTTKIDIYSDRRIDGEEDGDGDEDGDQRESMKDWDQNKLEQVVDRKHKKGPVTTTEIVCKHFIDAIEKKNYGWFWECPNGGDSCKYRHALPPGFVLKSQQKSDNKRAGEEEPLSLEEFLEVERYKIKKTTPVTPESFALWKKRRVEEAEKEALLESQEKEKEVKAGKMMHVSGKDLFTYNPDMYLDTGDDDGAMDDTELIVEESDHDGSDVDCYGRHGDHNNGPIEGSDDDDLPSIEPLAIEN